MDRFGRSKHRWVVEYIRAKTPRTTATVEESDQPEPAPFRPLDSSKMKILNERQQAGEHLQNLALLHNRRGEEARGYGKYLTGTVNAVWSGGSWRVDPTRTSAVPDEEPGDGDDDFCDAKPWVFD